MDTVGKTTLLNTLANRASFGLVNGERIFDNQYNDKSFERRIGFAQQQDIHLTNATVREALRFSARLRQPGKYTDSNKLAYVEEVIKTLNMSQFANAIIGVPGEGLNVEQRKVCLSGELCLIFYHTISIVGRS